MGQKERSNAPLPSKVSRYDVLLLLGEGGMGRVCLGRIAGPGGFERLVAIKLLHEHLGRRRGFVEMFLDEARVAARIRHPNVVPVLEVGEDNGQYFIAMDYVSGETLARSMNRLHKHDRRLPAQVAAHLISSACEGLHAAHELRGPSGDLLGVVHRDVSPENLIIGYDGTLRVTDFGVVKFAEQSFETAPGTWKGKAGYLAPELIEGRPIDRRADIFGLGIVLWEASMGRPLFRSDNPFKSAELIRACTVPLPRSIDPEYPPELEKIVLKALSRSPDDRHSTARELGEELRRWIASTGQMVGPVEIEHFMGALFDQRKRRRHEMERRASTMQPIKQPPPAPAKPVPLEPIQAESLLDRSEARGWNDNAGGLSSDSGAAQAGDFGDRHLEDDPLLDALISAHSAPPPPGAPPAREVAPSPTPLAFTGEPPREESRSIWPMVMAAIALLLVSAAVAFYVKSAERAERGQNFQRVSVPEIDPHGTKAPDAGR